MKIAITAFVTNSKSRIQGSIQGKKKVRTEVVSKRGIPRCELRIRDAKIK